MTNLFVIFLTGLTVGGLTCLAVQGGLLASVVASSGLKSSKFHTLFATSAFLIAKLIAYIALGFILGLFGGVIAISEQVQSVMQLLAGIYMIIVALNLLEVHPIFRYFIIQPPRFLARLVRNQARSKDFFAPALLGAMTIFIPCGTTLAIETLAISSANGISGALIMGSFILGTMPLFFGIGYITSLLGDVMRKQFYKVAAVIIIIVGILSINGSLVTLGSSVSLQSIVSALDPRRPVEVPVSTNPLVITITSAGYSPNYFRVRKGQPVTIKLMSSGAYSCASAFRIPSLKIAKNLKVNDVQTISFTPTATGPIPFTCAMGMYSGVIEVI